MSYPLLEDLNIYTLEVLEGRYICKDNELFHKVCKSVKHINCSLYFKTFSIDITKTKYKLKVKIHTVVVSKDLISVLDNLPNNIDVLEIHDSILNEVFSNLPINLKKLILISYYKQNILLMNNLLKYKIPFGLKIISKVLNTEKYIVNISDNKVNLILT